MNVIKESSIYNKSNIIRITYLGQFPVFLETSKFIYSIEYPNNFLFIEDSKVFRIISYNDLNEVNNKDLQKICEYIIKKTSSYGTIEDILEFKISLAKNNISARLISMIEDD